MNRPPLLGLAATFLVAACAPNVTGNGVPGAVERAVAPFDAVDISLAIEATVTASAATQRVTLSGDENLLQYVLTPVEGGVLSTRLQDVSGITSIHPLRLIAQVASLRAVRASQAAIVEVRDAGSTDPGFTFEVEASGAGHVLLKGPGGQQLSVVLSGAAGLDATAYPVEGVDAVVSGASTLRVHSSGGVVGSASGASHVEISGGGTCAALVLDLTSTCHASP
jgi:hypothetical protein